MGAVSAPMAAKAAADTISMDLAGVGTKSFISNRVFDSIRPESPPACVESPEITYKQIQMALKMPFVRDKIIEIIKEDNRSVPFIDPDLAVLKAPSLAAKIAWQRQRNIERTIKKLEKGSYGWQGATSYLAEILSTTGLIRSES